MNKNTKEIPYAKFIKNDIATFANDVDVLRNLIRYQNCPRLINESVAEHSFYVAIMVLKLREYYNFDLEKALKMALIHDIPESFISDVPHNIKTANPDLSAALEAAENKVIKTIFSPEAEDMLNQFNSGSTPEGLACQLADIISVVLYSHDELLVGNTKFNYIAIKAIARVKEVIGRLSPYINDGYTNDQIVNKINQIVNIY